MTLRNAAKDFRNRVDPLAYGRRVPYIGFDPPRGGEGEGGEGGCLSANSGTARNSANVLYEKDAQKP